MFRSVADADSSFVFILSFSFFMIPMSRKSNYFLVIAMYWHKMFGFFISNKVNKS